MNPVVRKIGWAYVCYHLVLFLVGVYDAASSYWSIGDFFGELATGFTYYPVVVPALHTAACAWHGRLLGDRRLARRAFNRLAMGATPPSRRPV